MVASVRVYLLVDGSGWRRLPATKTPGSIPVVGVLTETLGWCIIPGVRLLQAEQGSNKFKTVLEMRRSP